jgi:hypothetical protein
MTDNTLFFTCGAVFIGFLCLRVGFPIGYFLYIAITKKSIDAAFSALDELNEYSGDGR